MKKSKRIISLLLSVLMIVTTIPLMTVNSVAVGIDRISDHLQSLFIGSNASQFASRVLTEGNFTIDIKWNGTAELIEYNGTETDVVIPSTIGGYTVTWIDSDAFSEGNKIETISFPDTVSSGLSATTFENCLSLKSIIVDENNETYETLDGVLFCKGLTGLINYPAAKQDEKYDFSLEEYKNLESIDQKAFYGNTYLKEIVIAPTVAEIGMSAFGKCTALQSVVIPKKTGFIDSLTFVDCSSLEYAKIEGRINWIPDYIFGNCTSLKTVEIDSDIVDRIESCAFYNCTSLENIKIPDTVEVIGDYAFNNCSSLKEVIIPDSVRIIGENVFKNCLSLKKAVLSNSLTEIPCATFYKCSTLENIVIPDSVTTVKASSFHGCTSLESVLIGNNVEEICSNAFMDCSSLKNITIGNSVRKIGGYAFYGCSSLGNIVIPDSVTTINSEAFKNCTLLKSVAIPETVINIEDEAFGYYDKTKNPDFVICGQKETTAEEYAKDNGFVFRFMIDVPFEEWYYNAIAFNVNKGYLKGYENGYFGPADNIQRQDFVVLLSRIAGADLSAYEGQNGGFADVPMNDYYSAAVAWAKDNNILSGYENGLFGVGDPITREQACKIFYNYYTKYCDKGVGSSNSPETVCGWYPDGDKVSDWAKTAVAWAAESHIVGGNGTLNPAGNANRAETAQIIMNMSNNGIL